MGFDHVALCVGAGQAHGARHPERPCARRARGVRFPHGAATHRRRQAQTRSPTCRLRLPVVVIGGGLTAIDTATESLAYYAVQVEKFLVALRDARREIGEAAVRDNWDDQEREIAEEFLATRAPSATSARSRRASSARRASSSCCSHWGGVTIAYRRRLIDSPSYTLNHEEVEKALEEGICFAEGLAPAARGGGQATAHACGIRPERSASRQGASAARRARSSSPPARSPTRCSRARMRRTFALDGKYFRACDEDGAPVKPRARHRQARAARRCCCSGARTAASSASSATCIRPSSATS